MKPARSSPLLLLLIMNGCAAAPQAHTRHPFLDNYRPYHGHACAGRSGARP